MSKWHRPISDACFHYIQLNELSVGIDENEFTDTGLEVFPNPANESIHLRISKINNIDEIKFTVKNIQGELIYSGKIENEISLNTTEWAQGMYFIQCGKSVRKVAILK